MEQQANAQGLVLDYALELARKCVDTVKSTELDFGRVHEHVPVADREWSITARYWTDGDVVKVNGGPLSTQPDPNEQQIVVQGMPPALARIMQLAGDEEEEHEEELAFEFQLPARWLPRGTIE